MGDREAYDLAVGGSLRIKGGASKIKIVKPEMKKKRKKRKSDIALVIPREETTNAAVFQTPDDPRTEAEKKAEEKRRKREEEAIKKQAKLSYREQIKVMNEKLDQLTEHFDIPKVGPG